MVRHVWTCPKCTEITDCDLGKSWSIALILHVVRHSWKLQFDHLGAASKAILKPVYRFGIPNSDPQTLKSVKINSCRNIQMTVLSYSECKIVKIFRNSILHATGEDLQRQPRFPRCLTVFHLATFVEKPPPQKNCWIRQCI